MGKEEIGENSSFQQDKKLVVPSGRSILTLPAHHLESGKLGTSCLSFMAIKCPTYNPQIPQTKIILQHSSQMLSCRNAASLSQVQEAQDQQRAGKVQSNPNGTVKLGQIHRCSDIK